MHRTLFTVAALLLAACNQSAFEDVRGPAAEDTAGEDEGPGGSGPGDGARDPDDDVTCEVEEDCNDGETCLDGVCQMQRCKDGPYASAPPLAAGMRFHFDREVVVADSVAYEGEYWIDGYAPAPGSIEYPGSWSVGAAAVVDVAGGDFLGRNPELFAVALADSTRITIGPSDDPLELDLGFPPRALAAGDVDGDGKDEVLALGQFGNYGVCDVDERSCGTGSFQNGNGIDLAAGDLDADGVDEVVLLLDAGGTKVLYGMSFADGVEDFQAPAGHELMAIDVGDPDGDGTDEVYGLEDDGVFSGAMLYAYSGSGGGFVQIASQSIDDASRDLSFADVDIDERDELIVLREGRTVELLRGEEGSAALGTVMTHVLQVSSDPHRIAATDFDGDSPRTRLVDEEPVLVPGPVVPLTLALFPPFDAEHSDGVSSVSMGQENWMGEDSRDTVALEMAIDVGVTASLFDIFKAGVGTRIATSIEKYSIDGMKKTVGVRMSAEANPRLVGDPYGVMALSCGCFHAYYYEVDDPAGMLGEGGHEEQFVLVVPVGGTTTLWSTKRYNAMAKAVGNLPVVEIPYRIGSVASYPSGPEKLDGSPIPTEDFVFEQPPNILVSDIGESSFNLAVSEHQLDITTRRVSIDLTGELGIGPFRFAPSLGARWGEGYGIEVGELASFGGTIPPIPDDPDTPEDEYLEFSYATMPFVYREHYEDAEGEEAGYYVISYAVAQE